MNMPRWFSMDCPPWTISIIVCWTVFCGWGGLQLPSAKADEPSPTEIQVEPFAVQLDGKGALRGLLVHGRSPNGRIADLTRIVRYSSGDPQVVRVTDHGVLESVGDGQTQIRVEFGRQSIDVAVTVANAGQLRPVHFENDILPILSRYGCNMSACHGKAEGQNGFKLSVFGSEPAADYSALTKESRGRRLFLADADRSLVLLKAAGQLPHGGGLRIKAGSREYSTVRDWIATGVPIGDPQAARVLRIDITPRERILDSGARQQLRVIATYTDGRQTDVTDLTRYQSNNDGLATVDETGWVEVGKSPGQVAIMAIYQGSVAVFQALLPRFDPAFEFPEHDPTNFIDRLVEDKLRSLNIAPSQLCADSEFIRRVSIDLIGTLPTADEVRAFLDDGRSDKRLKYVERLLERPEYVDYWAQQWADRLRVDRRALGHKGAYEYFRWIRQGIAENKPIDRFARELITASGRVDQSPQARFFQVSGNPGETASTLSQVFLGVRIACAQCHHHPFDRWEQDDYYGMAAYFQPVTRKATNRGEMLVTTGLAKATNPRSGQEVLAHPLTVRLPAEPPAEPPAGPPAGDARKSLAEWMTSADNPWFARNIANRLWAHLMGRGLVEPVDDLRDTNPPSNPQLLDALAKELVVQQFDVKKMLLTITMSKTYQRSSHPNRTNELDEQNYSRALLRPMDAEVLLDAICDVAGIGEKFEGLPSGYRAIQLWDSEVDHYFLKLFGRPTRKTACVCERNSEPNVGQVLHVLNSPEIQSKLAHEAGRIARLSDSISDDGALAEEAYLTCLSRRPTSEERQLAIDYLSTSASRRAGLEDLVWTLLNTLEFVFNH